MAFVAAHSDRGRMVRRCLCAEGHFHEPSVTPVPNAQNPVWHGSYGGRREFLTRMTTAIARTTIAVPTRPAMKYVAKSPHVRDIAAPANATQTPHVVGRT